MEAELRTVHNFRLIWDILKSLKLIAIHLLKQQDIFKICKAGRLEFSKLIEKVAQSIKSVYEI